MPAPVAVAAVPLVGKLGAALKGLFAAKKVAGAAGAAKQLSIPGLKAATKTATVPGNVGILGNVKRMAGDVMTDYLGGPANPKNLAMNFGLDGAFGVMAGMQEPGDLGDKLIRGLTVAGAGGLGGVGATVGVGKLTGRMPDGLLRQATEVGGALLGDHIGYSLADGMQRAKNNGMTAWEQESLRQQMKQMYGPGGADQVLYENGLA